LSTAFGRRAFLRGGALAAGRVAGSAAVLSALMACTREGRPSAPHATRSGGYGLLRDDPAGVLALPEGFSYVRFGDTGSPMSDGNPTPAAHDGMGAFPAPDGKVLLVRNHELDPGEGPRVPGTPRYDPDSSGGTVTLRYDPRARRLEASYPSIAGTSRNCAGGMTPWGSWLTCEETFDSGPNRRHGYVFEAPAAATAPVEPVPLRAMGRFVHEAVAVDPATGIVYETEDRDTAGFYRFLPARPGELARGGRLQMLAITGRPRYDTRTGQRVGEPLPAEWVDIADPDPGGNDDLAVYGQGRALGGATFARLEGAWWGEGSVFINATNGGDAGAGQVWQYRHRNDTGGDLTLLVESPSRDVLDSPDNLTVSPGGGLILCEDALATCFLRGVTRQGTVFDLARNDLNTSEFAGATFSPDGQTLFVNLQVPGITFAITGPFDRGIL
jgi:secreted PhoX family phosphatase